MSMLANFATSISFLITLYTYPHRDELDDDGKRYLKITQILSTVGLGFDTATQIFCLVKSGFHCCSVIVAPAVSLSCNKKWKELNEQRGSWPVFKLKIWNMFTHNVLLLAATAFYLRTMRDVVPVSQRISVFFKIVALLISMGIFFFIELPLKCCVHKTGKVIDKNKDKIEAKKEKIKNKAKDKIKSLKDRSKKDDNKQPTDVEMEVRSSPPDTNDAV
ncbi:hypothetical protein SAMD00019534_102610 [Acytostelium subglobosum LB1]|uniref:hypothetical protein n=1 Tax=Acytostelium subglobosum LB1 TaxID=1410327 RepID=UPI0006448D4F|nr:hypothetical protein SAMD00019534_102610 [Acytostelium subglobosum LB1]GAM27086.1 hypothetical protein SAMD00019534_102610 [Acytostelium subglobosum LB1]|eukprot:XP_012749966.1 hypothetical protein SAMD00019534_102610 [Acytostelium subglobosum LB1]